ncbi:hypothetical protein QFC19_001134 [Naganishia cerealis]|uniref:Uncharacterized protein n=1 Tax=Naganishia cerealis TaxID=610337 RepID=A0ACC2WIX0_9TREE|nr:hypothetical protein QFC19_001134 [Naganishia cerealis]
MLRLAPPIKYIRILAIAVILTSTGFLLLSHLTAVSPISHNEQSLQVSPTTFDIVAAARLEQLQTRYKEEEVQGEVGLKIGNPDWTEYVNDLQGVYEQFFQSSRTERRKGPRIDETRYTRTPNASSAVQDVREQLADSLNLSIESTTLHDSQGHKTQVRSIPHTIYTTSKTPTFPEQFASWKQLNSKDGWDVEYYDNERIWRWMVEIFDRQGRSSSSSTNVKKSGAEILRVYGQLPQGVQRGMRTSSSLQ